MMIWNRMRARGWMISPARSPIIRPPWRAPMTSAPKSCTAPMKMVPKMTQMSAGTQPQITATAGPMIGAAPAIDV